MRDWGERDPRWRGIRSETLDIAHDLDRPGELTSVHLLRAGDDADGATGGGLPALLVHGLGGAATNWLEVMTDLAATGPVVAVDLPGFGRTEPPDPRAARLRPQVRFLLRFLRELGWTRVRLHGNSMGGLLALLLAAEAPRMVDELVLTSPALSVPRRRGAVSPMTVARFAPFLTSWTGTLAMQGLYSRMDAEAIRRRTIEVVMGEAEDLRPPLREVQLENVESGRSFAWRAPAFAHAAADLVGAVTVSRSINRAIDATLAPTLVVWGDGDLLVGRHAIDAAVARRPDWVRVDLDGVGHVAQLEAPDRWLDAVHAWPRDRRSGAN